MHTVYLHTGSNMGNREKNLELAIMLIDGNIGDVVKSSSIYQTKAWGNTDQPDFFNQALKITTNLSPTEVLEAIFEIENYLGRERTKRWAPRPLDIDILFYDKKVIDTPKLTIPHKHLHERNFVLYPLVEIAPNYIHPKLNKNVKELVISCTDTLEATPL